MRIAISGWFLSHPNTGTGQYSIALMKALGKVCSDELYIIAPRPVLHFARALLEGHEGPWRVVSVPVPLPGDLGKIWFEQIGLVRACRRIRSDVLHVPYFAPPLVKPCKTVITIHDLIMLLFPETRRSPQARLYTRLTARAASGTDLVLADSYSTREDIVRVLGISPDRIRVTHLACNEALQPVREEPLVAAVRKRYGLGGDFIFYIGGLDWRKNLPRLLRAFAHLPDAPPLAIAGKAFSQSRASFPDLRGLSLSLGIQDRVVFLGPVSESDKVALYSACKAFVFPSLYEGFGLTPLEAMTCGAPVVCSKASSLPEVVGDAAILFDPESEAELAACLNRVLSDPELRREMSRKGLEQARRFTWLQTAAATVEAYQAAAMERAAGRIWGNETLPLWNTALRRAREIVHRREGRVLEVGSGAGRFIRSLMPSNPGASFFGCDLDAKALASGRAQDPHIHFAAADVHALPYNAGQFRTVLVFDVLEHLKQPALAVAELHRVLDDDGLLHALIPCEGQPLSLHWVLWKLRLASDLKERHCGHVQRFSRRAALALLRDAGFDIYDVTYSMHPLGQLRDILSYLRQERRSRRRLVNPLFGLLMRLLWAAAYIESNLLFKRFRFGAVAMHVSAKKKAAP